MKFLVAIVLAIFLPSLAQAQPARHALVIGIGNYQHIGVLANPVRDAKDMAAKLASLGFTVHPPVIDGTREDMERSLREFKLKVKSGDEVVLYYSGHAVQLSGDNYLLGRDVPLSVRQQEDLADRSVRMQRMLNDMSDRQARVVLAIFDACRDNPIQWLQGSGTTKQHAAVEKPGMAQVQPPSGQMILYATGANALAVDRLSDADRDPNSLFTRILLKEIGQPGVSVAQMAKRVQALVDNAASKVQRRQIPAIYDQMPGEYYLAGAPNRTESMIGHSTGLLNSRLQEAYPGGPVMVPLPIAFGGYLMGGTANNHEMGADKGAHLVELNYPFALSDTEITVGQYLQCVAEGICYEPEWRQVGSKYHYLNGSDRHYRNLGAALTNLHHPIVGVSWFNANQFADWVTRKAGLDGAAPNRFRLPSEAEWEYAARAENASPTSSTAWGHGDEEIRLGQFAWFNQNSLGTTHQVRGKTGNGFGLYDMAGNVWEWTQDCYTDSYPRAPTNGQPVGRSDDLTCARILRGGSWLTSSRSLRPSTRNYNNPEFRSNSVGFRLARTLIAR